VILGAGSEPIPGYRLTRPLGVGAFAEVWEARATNGTLVALKFHDCRTKPNSVISSEIRVLRGLKQLQHPHIIQLHGVHAAAHYIVLSMERADGNLGDLRRTYREETGKNIPPDHALELLEQVAEGLDFLADLKLPGFNVCSRGLQHCDVKPSNLLLVGEQVKIADFGLCAGVSWQTHRNGWKGTPPYAAPELFKGQAAPGTDQYALAVTWCELVAGSRPFWESAAADDTLFRMPINLTRIREREVPVISRALHPHPTSRYPSCRAFVAALREAVQAPRRPGSPRLSGTSLRRVAH
jgi:serine/threonine protein kinase